MTTAFHNGLRAAKNGVHTAWIYEKEDHIGRTWFEGEVDGLHISSNIPELCGEPIVFFGESREELKANMISRLKALRFNGVLRVRK